MYVCIDVNVEDIDMDIEHRLHDRLNHNLVLPLYSLNGRSRRCEMEGLEFIHPSKTNQTLRN